MHIPDGFLSPPVWATLDALSVPAVGLLARRAQREVEEKTIPLLGVMGAFVFAAQMINFPVGAGTSGHLVGGALLAIVLGPASAAVVMTAILAIQALIFQDGGIIVLGANVVNMSIAGVAAGYLPYRLWSGTKLRGAAIFLGGVFSVLVSACLALAQLLLSGVRMPGSLLWVSIGLFTVSALLEGAITLAVVGAIERLNPSWVRRPAPKRVLSTMALTAVLVAVVGVLFASAAPDGIQRLTGHAQVLLKTPLAGYELGWFDAAWMRKSSAGLAGLALIYGACLVFGKLLARRGAGPRPARAIGTGD